MRTGDFWNFIQARHRIYLCRKDGDKKPWTRDKILQQYRFCNVYRELDKVTVWIRERWRDPHKHDRHVWFAMVVARLINWPESLADVPYPDPWKPSPFVKALDLRKRTHQKVFTGAYMIHADAVSNKSKAGYLAEMVLSPLWDAREDIFAALRSGYLKVFHEALMNHRDMGSFMAGQVVADVKYTALGKKAKDWWEFVAMGPGSQRGLNRLSNYKLETKWEPRIFADRVNELRDQVNDCLADLPWERFHAQDIQNCLCEFDKYERVRLGEGRPRSLYDGV